MADIANLNAEDIALVEKLEEDLRAMGADTMTVAFENLGESERPGMDAVMMAFLDLAELSPEAINLIKQLEEKLKEEGKGIALVSYKKES